VRCVLSAWAGAAGTIEDHVGPRHGVTTPFTAGSNPYVCRPRLEVDAAHGSAEISAVARKPRRHNRVLSRSPHRFGPQLQGVPPECHADWRAFQAHPLTRTAISSSTCGCSTRDRPAARKRGHRRREPPLRRLCLNHEPRASGESLPLHTSTAAVEIDMTIFSGIAFRHVDKPRDSPAARAGWG